MYKDIKSTKQQSQRLENAECRAADPVMFFGRSLNDSKRCEAMKNKILSIRLSRKFAKNTVSTAKIYTCLPRKNDFLMSPLHCWANDV